VASQRTFFRQIRRLRLTGRSFGNRAQVIKSRRGRLTKRASETQITEVRRNSATNRYSHDLRNGPSFLSCGIASASSHFVVSALARAGLQAMRRDPKRSTCNARSRLILGGTLLHRSGSYQHLVCVLRPWWEKLNDDKCNVSICVLKSGTNNRMLQTTKHN